MRRVLVARVARALGRCGWSRARRAARWRVRAARGRRRMHATGHTDRSGGGGGGGSWRLPPDETLQVADPKSAKEEVSLNYLLTNDPLALRLQYRPKVSTGLGSNGHGFRKANVCIGQVLPSSGCLCLCIVYVRDPRPIKE